MEWISVKDQMPPRDRKLLIYDKYEWAYVGLHERNYLKIEIPESNVDYNIQDEKRLLTAFFQDYRDAINPNLFRCITFDICGSEAIYWMELPKSPYINEKIWINKKDKAPKQGEAILMYHERLGVIEGYNLNQSDTFSCKTDWDEDDIKYWKPLPEPQKE